jgi:hypothetical protein
MRSFSLPENTDGSKLSADYKDGMLTVRLPKAEKTKPKAIESRLPKVLALIWGCGASGKAFLR